jgi:ADP-heptose:LPS heptosyltransferase
VDRILVLQQRQIGDVLLATPAIGLLKEAYPRAELDFFTETQNAPVLENNPHVDRILRLDKKTLGGPLRQVHYYLTTARSGYSLVVDFQQLPRCRYLTVLSGAPVRLSFTPPWYHRFIYNMWHSPQPGYTAGVKAEILAPLGIEYNGERPRLYLAPNERRRATDLLNQTGISEEDVFLTVDATHRRDTRRWPVAHYARLLDLLAISRPRLRFLLLYGPGEVEEVRNIRRLVRNQDRIHIPEEMIGLRDMAAIQERALLHVGNCSAPAHFAVAVDTPSFVIRGSTDSQSWTCPSREHADISKGLSCQPCRRNRCPHGPGIPCLDTLDPETVAKAVDRHLVSLQG